MPDALEEFLDETETGNGDVPEEPQAPMPEQGSSLLDGLRKRREAIGKDTWTVLDIPGYDGVLRAQYRLPEFKVMERWATRIERSQGEASINAAADLIAEVCDQILVRDPGHEDCIVGPLGEVTEDRPIDPGHGPTRFDAHLAKLLEIDLADDARISTLVRLVFNREFALSGHVLNDLLPWMRQGHREVTDDFVGESLGR